MPDETILLFLHGVGDGDHGDSWKSSIQGSLTDLGYPDLDAITVIAPKYAHALRGLDEKEAMPAVTQTQPTREAARQNRRDFERRMGAIEYRLGRHDSGAGLAVYDRVVGMAVALPYFAQARMYVTNADIRANVLSRILSKLPSEGRIVIIGHSLGSVIAADLLPRLPIGLEVVGMVTIGSPLANGSFSVDKLRETLREPPTNLAWWINFWNAPDPVAAHRGVSSVFPWMVDFRLATKSVAAAAHSAHDYLSHETVAAAVGYALFGSRSTELERSSTAVEIPLDYPERLALLGLRYATLIGRQLDGDLKDRYSGALRYVQASTVDEIARRNANEGRPLPFAVARLSFDLSDSSAVVPEVLPGIHISKEEAVVTLTTLAFENVVLPFEITVSNDKRQEAMKELAAEIGLGSKFGADVFAATKSAHEALSGARINWLKWGALGAGAAAIAVAAGGLVVVTAGAGFAGAAAITSGFAAFGPGGMIGGLLTAGTLVTAGGGGIALGLASPATTAEALQSVLARHVAIEILRKKLDLGSDPAVWALLVRTEIEVRREHEMLDEFSDASALTLKELKRKIAAVERALAFLRVNGLEPGVEGESSIS